MKRMIMTLVAVWMMITSMNAQRLTNIQAEARFITDKMVVELGLSRSHLLSLIPLLRCRRIDRFRSLLSPSRSTKP